MASSPHADLSMTTGRRIRLIETMLLAIASIAVLMLDAHVNELHGTAVFYASLVREMLSDGWFAIFEGERAYFLKPPLVLWLSAAGAEIFGLNNFGVTLAPRLAAILCVALTYCITNKLYDHRVAGLAAIVLLTNSTFIQFSATLRMDSMLLFGGLLSVYAWLERGRTWSSPAIFIGITIGVLSKGPLGLAPILLIVLHALLFKISIKKSIRWRWLILALPIVCWYGYLYSLHGLAPFNQLGSDLAKPAANVAANAWQETLSEYVLKPARRYLPFLPFMLIGSGLALFTALSRQSRERPLSRWLLMWVAVVFIAAAAKPDKDIRYLYMGLPVLAVFAANSIALLAHRFKFNGLTAGLALLTISLALFFNYGPRAKPDTRPIVAAIANETAMQPDPLIALGGYPIPPHQPRRQNTHRDWIYFYLGREPSVLAWRQLTPEQIQPGDAFLLTNNRSHKQRLAEYGLTAKHKTIEMVYAVRE